jgi:hypothetical protein
MRAERSRAEQLTRLVVLHCSKGERASAFDRSRFIGGSQAVAVFREQVYRIYTG